VGRLSRWRESVGGECEERFVIIYNDLKPQKNVKFAFECLGCSRILNYTKKGGNKHLTLGNNWIY